MLAALLLLLSGPPAARALDLTVAPIGAIGFESALGLHADLGLTVFARDVERGWSLSAQLGQRGKGLRTGPSWLAGPGVWTAGLEVSGPERKSLGLGTYLQLDLLGVLQTRVAVGGSLRGTGDLEFSWGVGPDVARVIFIIHGLRGLCIGC
jgi:hypothetical protein